MCYDCHMIPIALSLQEALVRPLHFAQVREDPLMDLQVIAEHNARSAFFIGSGGCTVAAVAALGGLDHLVVAEPNSAQMALVELKLLLLSFSTKKRGEILGYYPMEKETRSQVIADLLMRTENHKNIIGDINALGSHGPDFYGRHEWLLMKMREAFSNDRLLIDAALKGEKVPYIQSYLEAGIGEAFSLPILKTLFGKYFSQYSALTFSQHYVNQTMMALNNHPQENYFLQRFLQPERRDIQLPLWMSAPEDETGENIERYTMSAQEVLGSFSGEHDVIHLSNILDSETQENAIKILHQAYLALNKNGCVIIRQLNCNLNISNIAPQFLWNIRSGQLLLNDDSSFIYSHFYVGKKY